MTIKDRFKTKHTLTRIVFLFSAPAIACVALFLALTVVQFIVTGKLTTETLIDLREYKVYCGILTFVMATVLFYPAFILVKNIVDPTCSLIVSLSESIK